MNAKPEQGASARDRAGLVIETLRSHLTPGAQERTIRQVVAGARFCAVVLDDGGTGLANLCPDVCGEPSRRVSDWLPQPGTAATDVLATLASSARSALGLATANALANRPDDWGGPRGAAAIGGDLLDVLELRPDDHVGMVGCFSPLVEPIRQRVHRLSIFERAPRLSPDLLPENRAADLLPECSVALITATALMNGTIDALLGAAAHCREVVLLGPSTPLAPEVFAEPPRRVSLLSGMVAADAGELLRAVARGGGTRDFGTSAAKINVRVA
ncbi:MAG: DUF364 domain-containing protein [Planctomycetota bacterium]